MEILTEKQCFSRIGAAYFTFAAATMALQVVAVAAIALLAPAFQQSSAYLWVVSLVPMYCVAMPVCVAMLRRVPGARPAERALGVKGFWKALVICFGVMYAGNLLGVLATQLVGLLRGRPVDNNIADVIEQSSVLANFLFTVLLAPVIEETLFRKLLIDRVKQFGDLLAVVLSGVMFGLFHGNFSQFFYAAGVGMVFAYVYVRTGRLRYSIAMHMIVNFMGAVLAPLMLSLLGDTADLAERMLLHPEQMRGVALAMLYVFALLACAVTGVALLIRERRRLVWDAGACPLPRGARIRTAAGNAGMIAFGVICIVMFAMNLSA